MEKVIDRIMPLNLQFFAEDNTPEEPQRPENTPEETPPDLNALLAGNKELQSQFDKQISQALATHREKWDKEKDLTAEQLAEEKAKERQQELTRREAELFTRELRAEAIALLGEKGLDVTLIDCVSLADGDAMKASVEKAEKAYRAAVAKGVDEKLKGAPPKAPNSDPDSAALAKVRAAAGLK